MGNIEGVHRFDDEGASISGGVSTFIEFDLEGQQYDESWLKAGIGVEGQLLDGKASLMLNGTTEGESTSAWFAASYQITVSVKRSHLLTSYKSIILSPTSIGDKHDKKN